jgi:hypothetical protein
VIALASRPHSSIHFMPQKKWAARSAENASASERPPSARPPGLPSRGRRKERMKDPRPARTPACRTGFRRKPRK